MLFISFSQWPSGVILFSSFTTKESEAQRDVGDTVSRFTYLVITGALELFREHGNPGFHFTGEETKAGRRYSLS